MNPTVFISKVLHQDDKLLNRRSLILFHVGQDTTCSPVKYEKLEKKTENVWKPRHVLHVTKGKYFKNKEVDMSSSDIETDGLNISYAKKQWFWKDGEGKWNPYSRETNARINKCHQRDPKSTVVVSVNNTR